MESMDEEGRDRGYDIYGDEEEEGRKVAGAEVRWRRNIEEVTRLVR